MIDHPDRRAFVIPGGMANCVVAAGSVVTIATRVDIFGQIDS